MPTSENHNELTTRLTALTRDLILIKSTDPRAEERARCFEFIEHHLEPVSGTRVRNLEDNGYTSMLVLPEGIDEPEILLCGHIDVIEHPRLTTYHSSIVDGRIIGPGAGDMKGAIAIILELFRSLHRSNPGISVGVAITSDEERGGEHGVRHLIEDAGLRCGIAIVPDGGSLADVTIEEKGILHLRVKSRGRAAHAARPWLGRNAVQELIGRLVLLESHFESLRPEGAIESGDHWFPTASLTRLSTPNETINRIPSRAEAILDVRFPPPHNAESILGAVNDVLGPELETEVIISAEATHLDSDPLFHEVTAEIAEKPVTLVKASGGSDARFFRAAGIPVNLSRPLVGNLHAEDEWIDIESMLTYYRICETYIKRKLGFA